MASSNQWSVGTASLECGLAFLWIVLVPVVSGRYRQNRDRDDHWIWTSNSEDGDNGASLGADVSASPF